MKRIGSFIAMVATVFAMACSKTVPTDPTGRPIADARQIVGPCYVSALLYEKGVFVGYASLHYQVCPPIALVDSLGEIETANAP